MHLKIIAPYYIKAYKAVHLFYCFTVFTVLYKCILYVFQTLNGPKCIWREGLANADIFQHQWRICFLMTWPRLLNATFQNSVYS